MKLLMGFNSLISTVIKVGLGSFFIVYIVLKVDSDWIKNFIFVLGSFAMLNNIDLSESYYIKRLYTTKTQS